MHYELKALRGTKDVVLLALDAVDEADALRQARSQGYTVLAARRSRASLLAALSRRSPFPLQSFSRELLVLLRAGLPLIEALESLAEKERSASAKSVIARLCVHLREGQPLSAALGREPGAFPALYVATVRASERSGDLAEALSRFVVYQTQLDMVRSKVVSASIYPLLLVGAGALVTLFLMFYVVPRFSRIYEDLGDSLPAASVWLLHWGRFLESYFAYVLIAAGGALAASVHAFRRPGTRRWIEKRLWGLPGLGERMRVYQLARFYRMAGMLLRGGTPIVPALRMAAGLLHPVLREPLALASRGISEGSTASQSFERSGLTTPVALRMLAVGERSGTLGEMMEQIAVFHDEEVARWVDRFTRLFEPLLMALIGLVIGAVVILMYLPIFELAGSIQ